MSTNKNEQIVYLSSITVCRNWKKAICTIHEDVLTKIGNGTVAVIIGEDKAKLVGIDKNNVIRKKCWDLRTPHSVSETNSILLKEFGVSIPIEKIETEAEKILNGNNKKTKKKVHSIAVQQPAVVLD